MDVTLSIAIIWACTGGFAAIGLGLLGVAICGGRASFATALSTPAASRPEYCPCCGYDARGLEDDLCPECGSHTPTGHALRSTRKRTIIGACGVAMLFSACVGPWADHVARHGIVHATPAEVLTIVGRYVPSTRAVITRNLLGRADAESLPRSARQSAATLAAITLDSAADASTRRASAALLAATADAAPDDSADRLLRDRDSEVRSQGVRALSRLAEPTSRGACIASRIAIASRLGRIALRDRSDQVRRLAIDELGDMTGTGARMHVLVAALEDSSRSVRMRALFALSRERTLSASAVFAVSRCLLDEEHDVRMAALLVVRRARG
ncbi:MAG: HEAT repeat domain-containing protein [Phycisphaerales bacterium]|nr:HEAT repeat domain-containing protein [Phycisphaerales bacterium]